MKRTALVCYSSSEDEGGTSVTVNESPPKTVKPPTKRKKLPPLSSTIAPSPPPDNPALHQGRIRTTPHVDGQFSAHIYVTRNLHSATALGKLVDDVIEDSKKLVPTLNDLGTTTKLDSGATKTSRELHVSLSRPVYLRAHQREGLKVAIRNVARQTAPFEISFAAFSVLVNDEKTRAFLTMEIGAGHHELRNFSDALTPSLTSIKQKGYYENPRFHASIAWALLSRGTLTPPSGSTIETTVGKEETPERAVDVEGLDVENAPAPISTPDFPTIDQMPEELVPLLNEKYCPVLTSSATGSFEVKEVCVKIGKEVTSFRLSG